MAETRLILGDALTELPKMGCYSVLAVDPPWAYGSDSGQPNRTAESHYKTIGHEGKEVNRRTGDGIEKIAAAAPVLQWAEKNACLFLWTTNPKLPFAFALMESWKFTYKTTLTWIKTAKSGQPARNGMGWFFRGCTEHILFGTRGKFGIPACLRESNVILAERGEHSEKPDEFYRMVERVTPGLRRLDVFSRRTRRGWDSWGDEVDAIPPLVAAAGMFDAES